MTLLGRARQAAISLFTALAGLLGALYSLARRGLRALEGPTAGLRRRASETLGAASRALTPTRGLLLAALGCALLLGLSQFADYRGVAIGVDGYDPEIQSVAPAPEVDRAELGTAHAYLMVPAALIAIAILLIANRSGRWQLCRLAALIGVAAIVVAIAIDRPAGLDEGTLVRDFTGVEAKLLGGFWVQLVAGVGLAVTSLLLGAELRRTGADRTPKRRSRRPPGELRSETRAEGAGA